MSEKIGKSYSVTGVTGGLEASAGNSCGNTRGNTSKAIRHLADGLGDLKHHLADLEAKADHLRQKLIALGQSTVVGERYIATVRKTAMHEFDMDRLRKRITADQLQRCLVATEHVVVTVHERESDE